MEAADARSELTTVFAALAIVRVQQEQLADAASDLMAVSYALSDVFDPVTLRECWLEGCRVAGVNPTYLERM